MTAYFNILVTSISKKVPLLNSLRRSIGNLNLKGKLFGGDSNAHCIGRYFVDEFWLMPLQDNLDIEELINFCKQNGINGIIPSRDGELHFFSTHQERLSKEGISCMISKPKTIETCSNKLLFCEFLSPFKFPVIPTATDISLIPGPSFVVKECFGSGSHTIGLNLNEFQAQSWSKNLKDPIFQPFIEGKEYSIDIYITRQNTPHGAIARIRELVVDGESQMTVSVRHKEMEALCLKAAIHIGICGHAVFQVLCDSANRLHLIECNPRFGGASTLSVVMGLHSLEWFIQESLNQPLPPFVRSTIEMRQVRYAKDKVFPI